MCKDKEFNHVSEFLKIPALIYKIPIRRNTTEIDFEYTLPCLGLIYDAWKIGALNRNWFHIE